MESTPTRRVSDLETAKHEVLSCTLGCIYSKKYIYLLSYTCIYAFVNTHIHAHTDYVLAGKPNSQHDSADGDVEDCEFH